MPISARVATFSQSVLTIILSLCIGILFATIAKPVSAQTVSVYPTQTTNTASYTQPNYDSSVQPNSHTYAQVVVIDVLSALVCNLTGIDPSAPMKGCLAVNPVTSQFGYPSSQQLGYTPQSAGAIGVMSNMVGAMYVPTISSRQYTQYLSDNFGIIKEAHAQAAAPGADCSTSQFGYGFCGLQPIFAIWVMARDFSYALLVIAMIFLGVGVMLRFKMDARTVMTLQNEIPRVIIAILLITFSYAIAGGMIDIMWTVTYAGVNAISSASPAVVRKGCTGNPGDTPNGQKLGDAATRNLLDNPVSFANTIYLRDCEGNINSGIVNISGRVSDSFILLIRSVIYSILGWDLGGDCSVWSGDGLLNCLQNFGIWITDIIIILIITVAIFIALFRLWFELIKSYVTFFIFVIMGPIWIVFGLIPGRPLGFEKWFRLIVGNLCAYPLVAFILVFARVVLEAVPANPTPTTTFIPPLVGNPDASAFNVLMAFGAILIAPTIPSMIRERMGAGKNKFGPTVAAGIAVAAGAATAPAAKTWSHLNRHDSHGNPVGSMAIGKQMIKQKWSKITPWGSRFTNARQKYQRYPMGGHGTGSGSGSGSSGSGSSSSGSGGSSSGGGTP